MEVRRENAELLQNGAVGTQFEEALSLLPRLEEAVDFWLMSRRNVHHPLPWALCPLWWTRAGTGTGT